MLTSQKIAVAAHLHVLLRRKTGRVTDTEWMAENLDYAREIVRYARAKAAEDGHADLAEWADKLEQAVLSDPPTAPERAPLVQSALKALGRGPAVPAAAQPPDAPVSGFSNSRPADTGFGESTLGGDKPKKPRDPDAPRYVGGIR